MIYIYIIIIADAVDLKSDDFWDYDKQVDLEAFNTRALYDTLSKQSNKVTQTIGRQKDEVYLELKYETGNNRDL